MNRVPPQTVPNPLEAPPAWVPYLKVAVIVMGVMIVLGLIGLGYMLYQRSQKQAAEEAAAITLMPDPALRTAEQGAGIPSPASLGLPKGSRVTQMTATDNRLVLNIRVPTEGERIVIIDLRKGTVIGNVSLETGGP